MSDLLGTNINCVKPILDEPTTISKPSKRWRLAFAAIFCFRALNSLAKEKKKESSKLPGDTTPSLVVLNVQPDDFSGIDHTSLTAMVREKNVDQLLEVGGVIGVASALKTDIKNGISGVVDDVALRQAAFGSNTYQEPPAKSLIHFAVEASKDLTILILVLCATLSLVFGIKEHGLKEGWYDGASIFVAVLVAISVSAVSNFWQNRQIQRLCKVSNNVKVDVVRNGRGDQQTSIFDIVVGDVVCLKIGDQVPADGLFLDGHSLQVDESSMTGEGGYVEVNSDRNPFLLSGNKVADGSARMLVTSVGMNTTWGQMMSEISRDTDEQTPLQARLYRLTSSIGKVGLAVAFLVLVVLLARYFTGNTEDENGNQDFKGSKTKAVDTVNSVVRIIEAAITIVIAAIPEGSPLAATLILASSVEGMVVRSSPFDKLAMVQCLKQEGLVVAVTGDGTNARVLRWGRFVYNNIQKSIQRHLTMTLVTFVINVVAVVTAHEVPFTMLKLLWLNVILNTLSALALATQQPIMDLMEEPQPPVSQKQPLITNIMCRNILAQAVYQIAVGLTLQFKGESIFHVNEKVNNTLMLNISVLCQVFNLVNARKPEKKNTFKGAAIYKNKLFWGITGIIIILEVVAVEFLKKFGDTERLSWGEWGACIGVGALSWPIGLVVKYIPVSDRPFLSYI